MGRMRALYIETAALLMADEGVLSIQERAWLRALEERAALPIGTVRTWRTGNFVKTVDGWKRTLSPKKAKSGKVVLGPGDEIDAADYTENLRHSVDAVHALVKTGALPGSLAGQIDTAKKTLKTHKASYKRFEKSLQDAAPPGSVVSGRVKTFQSLLGKLALKPKYKDARGMQDITGTRVVCNNASDVASTVANLKKKYKVIAEDDYIANPKGDMKYRSHHLVVEDEDGQAKEIQVRTKRQDAFGHWAHESYKPVTEAKRQAIEKHAPEIAAYAAATSDYLAALDEGRTPGPKPKAPKIVTDTFGEIDTH